MTVGGINTTSLSEIQLLRAKQAFAGTQKAAADEKNTKIGFSEEDVKLSISSKEITIPAQQAKQPEEIENDIKKDDFFQVNKKYIGEIKDFINRNNYQVVEEEDIKHAMNYGKSILADYTA